MRFSPRTVALFALSMAIAVIGEPEPVALTVAVLGTFFAVGSAFEDMRQ